jgi:hypothetical protein
MKTNVVILMCGPPSLSGKVVILPSNGFEHGTLAFTDELNVEHVYEIPSGRFIGKRPATSFGSLYRG